MSSLTPAYLKFYNRNIECRVEFMNKDYSELIEYLDKKFAETVGQENFVDFRNEVNEKFDYIDKRFDETDRRLEAIEKRIDQLVNAVDRLAKAIEIYHHEQVALSAKVDRLEQWINQVAKHVGIELKP